jgi:hypothetical protein
MTDDELEKSLERLKKMKAAIRRLEQQVHDKERLIERKRILVSRLKVFEEQLRPDAPKGVGAPSIWKGEFGYQLFLMVEEMRKNGCTTKAALEALRELKKWPSWDTLATIPKYSLKELQSRYSEARPRWIRWRELLGEIDAELAELRAMAERIGPSMTEDEMHELIRPGHKDDRP